MKRSHHRAALTEAIADATARFEADLQRLARTVLRDELARILATNEPMPTPIVMGTRALRKGRTAGPRRSPAARPRKAAAATARQTTAVAMNKPTAAATSKPTAVASKPTAVATSKPTAAVATSAREATARASKPAAAAGTSPPAAAAGTHMDPPAARAGRPTAAPVPAIAGAPEGSAVPTSEPDQRLAGKAERVDLAIARPRADSASGAVAEPVPAAISAEPPWRERARDRREERAQRRQDRQERARSRRAAAGMRAEAGAVAGAHAEPTGAMRGEPMTAAVDEPGRGTDGTRAMGRRVERGTVKWFSEANGYGVITAHGGADAFVHHSAIPGEGFRTLREGQVVSYEEIAGPKGLLAVNVVPLG